MFSVDYFRSVSARSLETEEKHNLFAKKSTEQIFGKNKTKLNLEEVAEAREVLCVTICNSFECYLLIVKSSFFLNKSKVC